MVQIKNIVKDVFNDLLYRFIFWRVVRRGLSISDLHKEKKRLYVELGDMPFKAFEFKRTRIRIMAIEKHLQDIYNQSLVDGKQWPARDEDGNPVFPSISEDELRPPY